MNYDIWKSSEHQVRFIELCEHGNNWRDCKEVCRNCEHECRFHDHAGCMATCYCVAFEDKR